MSMGTTPLGYSFTKQGTTPTTTSYPGSNLIRTWVCKPPRQITTVLAPEDSLSRDPEGGIITDPATLHKYFYASGDR